MAKRQTRVGTNRVEQLIDQYLAATRTTVEAVRLDELAAAVNEAGGSALTPALLRRLTRKYRAATTSVERGNRLEELARLADATANAALKWYVLEAAEASTRRADDMLRIAAIEHCLPRFEYPDRRYERRVIDWLLGRLDIPRSWPGEERIYAIDSLRRWIEKPRVRDRMFALVADEREGEDLRSLALGSWEFCGRGAVPAKVIKLCQRYGSADTILGRSAAALLRGQGIKTPEPDAAPDRGGTSRPARQAAKETTAEPDDGSMTEAQWLRCADPTPMLNLVRDRRASKRKLRLATCACCRHVWPLMRREESRRAVEAGEQFADGLIDGATCRAVERTVNQGRDDERTSAADVAATWAIAPETKSEEGFTMAPSAAWAAHSAARAVRARKTEQKFQAALVRDIFGNPFRKTAVSRAWLGWRDGTVPRLARAAYDGRTLPAGELDPEQLARMADGMLVVL